MVDSLVRYSWLIPVLPALGGLVALLAGKRLGERAHLPVVAGIAASLVLSLLITFGNDHPRVATVYEWINISSPDLPADEPTLNIPVQFRADGLSTMMISMVTFLGLLICIFSSGYMHGDPGYSRFFFCFGLFIFSMTGLVLSNNFVLTYAFWEGEGVCSYLLIGYWYHKDSAAEAAKKAFLVNRIGDFGFAVALFWLWQVVPNHDLSYGNVLNANTLAAIPHNGKLGIALLLFWAAAAKSAQIPLYVWLPDAMEGPTPVSALIHAATMVTAGVYLIARSSLLIVEVPQAQLIICVTGCLTALLAALIALTQNDLKRVLAYSTVSQLGFMFMGLGAGIKDVAQFAVVAAIFHLFTHAFFKALLFLGSGSVMHAMGGILDMRRFSGLRHRLPTTFWTFAVGCVALAGLPPFAGFWSKDEILAALKQASHEGESLGYGGYYHAIYWAALFTALLTAFYTGRAFFKTFFGPEKLPSPDDPEANESFDAVAATPRDAAATFGVDTPAPESPELARYRDALGVAATSQDHVAPVAPAHGHGDHGHGHGHGHDDHGHDAHFGHESPPVMTIPLVILAVCATLVGLVFGPITGWLAHHLEHTETFDLLPHHAHSFDWSTAIIGTLVGVIGLAAAYWMYALPNPLPARIARTIKPLYRASFRKFYIDEIYGLVVVGPTLLLAHLSALFDKHVIDGLVRRISTAPGLVGRDFFRPLQNGLVQMYAATTALGLVVLLILLMFV